MKRNKNNNLLIFYVSIGLIIIIGYITKNFNSKIEYLKNRISYLEMENKKYSIVYRDYIKIRKQFFKILTSKYKLSEYTALKIINAIYKYSSKYDLNPGLIFKVIAKESAFDSMATSNKDAKGLMQLLPTTADLMADLLNINNYNIYSIENNIELGTYYLKLLLIHNDNDTLKALKKYFAGRLWYIPQAEVYANDVLNMTFQ